MTALIHLLLLTGLVGYVTKCLHGVPLAWFEHVIAALGLVVMGAYDGILLAVYHLSARKEKVHGTTSNEIDAIPETAHDAAWDTVPGGM
jgi:hypothetical protein